MDAEPSRKRAAAILGVPADADVAAVRSAFLRKLAHFDFTPPVEWHVAATRLGASLPHAADTMAEYEQADVEELLGIFWTLPLEARQARWKELDDRCRDSEARVTLDRVKLGLGVVVRTHEDAASHELARFIREIFVLSPREKAIRRMKWCADNAVKLDLVSLGYEFQYADPAVAVLAPMLLQMMQDSNVASNATANPNRSRFDPFKMSESKRAPDNLEPDRDDSAIDRHAEYERELAEAASIRRAVKMYELESEERRTKPETSRIAKRLWILIGVLLGLSSLWGFFWSDKSKDSPKSRYRYDEPSDQTTPKWPENNGKSSNIFTAEQIRQFKAYDPKSGKPEPNDYQLWRFVEEMNKSQQSLSSKK